MATFQSLQTMLVVVKTAINLLVGMLHRIPDSLYYVIELLAETLLDGLDIGLNAVDAAGKTLLRLRHRSRDKLL